MFTDRRIATRAATGVAPWPRPRGRVVGLAVLVTTWLSALAQSRAGTLDCRRARPPRISVRAIVDLFQKAKSPGSQFDGRS